MSAVRAAQTRPSGISVERHAGSFQRKRGSASENDVKTTNLTFSWHILDFGPSYVLARQAADQVLISNECRGKVINQIIEDVRAAHWSTVAAECTIGQLHRLNGRITRALNNSQELDRRAQASPLTALTYERELCARSNAKYAISRAP